MELDGKIDLNKIENIYIYVDEHVTATDGRYELREAIEQEFKHGTFNASWNHFYEPITPNVRLYIWNFVILLSSHLLERLTL